MDYTSQNEGILGVVKSFLPSLFVTFLGFIGHKILIRIGKKSSKEISEKISPETPAESDHQESISSGNPHTLGGSSHHNGYETAPGLPTTKSPSRSKAEGEDRPLISQAP